MLNNPPSPSLRYLNIHIWHEVDTYTRHTSWQTMTIWWRHHLATWLGYNLQTRNKMRNRYPILGFIANILISNFARHVTVTKELHPWHHYGGHVTWVQFADKINNEDQIWYLKFHLHFLLKHQVKSVQIRSFF